MRVGLFALALVAATLAGAAPPPRAPVIDMHIHVDQVGDEGPPSYICAPYPTWQPMDPGRGGGGGVEDYVRRMFGDPDCPRRFFTAKDDDDLQRRTIAALRRENAYGLAGGKAALVDRWLAEDSTHLLPAIGAGSPDELPSLDALRRRHAAGRLVALAELTFQYRGIAPDDPRLEPYWSLAEEIDVPVGIHMGPGPPGTTYFATPGYRAALSDPLLLEPVLVRHPRLRVFVVHAGYPMKERMLALMAAHPQVYAEFGVLTVAYPEREFWPYLKAFVDSGFEDRILYGTDQMVWPDMIGAGIERVRESDELTPAQKRKFLYDNAARFLRIDPAGTGVLKQRPVSG